MELKNKVESVLFSAGKKVHLDELTRLCHARKEDVEAAAKELKDEYDTKEASLMVMQEGEFWKLTVREKYLGLVRKIVTTTELSKTLMETLAVIAWKAPVKQSEVIKIRTNKAYDHLKELEEADYITREKHGRTKLIKLAKKFFEYFDIPEDRLKEKFKTVDQVAKAIADKESEIEAIKKDQKEKAEQKEVDLLDKEGHKVKLNEYELSEESKRKALLEEKPEIKPAKDHLGDLEVEDVPEPQEQKSEEESKEEVPEEKEEPQEEQEVSVKPEEPEEEEVLEIPKEALEEEPKKEEKKPEQPEEEAEIKEALKEIEEEKEETTEEEPQEGTTQEEADLDKKAEKRAEEIMTKEEEMTPEVEAEFESMLHPEGTETKEVEEAPEEKEEPEQLEEETKEKDKKEKKKPTPEKPDFEEEVEEMVETAGEEKAKLPEKPEGVSKESEEE